MDSDDVATDLGVFYSQREARHHCFRHAMRFLHFRQRQPGIWKAQGQVYWYQIQQVTSTERAERVSEAHMAQDV